MKGFMITNGSGVEIQNLIVNSYSGAVKFKFEQYQSFKDVSCKSQWQIFSKQRKNPVFVQR